MTPLLKLVKKQDTISLIILILLIPVVTRLNGSVNFIYILLTSNYITLILNIACLVLMYKKITIINGINHTLITRKGYKNTKHNIYAFSDHDYTSFLSYSLWLLISCIWYLSNEYQATIDVSYLYIAIFI
ncbi:hypothetical protein [Catenibacterium sp. co_0103]|uniref:hypothetical protein n=1 Tax=Catenibacterium sp. co_0103 TaxID=2478954 RepID=UPI0024790244|nr:hypothetical protein [Catenibacterium sp. co_0103]